MLVISEPFQSPPHITSTSGTIDCHWRVIQINASTTSSPCLEHNNRNKNTNILENLNFNLHMKTNEASLPTKSSTFKWKNTIYYGETNEELLFHQVLGEMVSEVNWKRNVDISFSTRRTINVFSVNPFANTEDSFSFQNNHIPD